MEGHQTSKIPVGIVGVSGYSGMELSRILSTHPVFHLKLATTDRWQGKKLGQRVAVSEGAADLNCVSQEEGKKRFGEVALLFLCTPAEVSLQLAPLALAAGARVVDLSGAFRLSAEAYPSWYGFTHTQPGLLAETVYSMPEATGKTESLITARLVSNPGCYPTPSTLAVLPLLRAGLMLPDPIFIDAKSGTTGAGRKASEEMSFSETVDDVRAYRILRHQHQPEIELALARAGVPGVTVVFTPHLLPVRRGILASAYGRLNPGITDPIAVLKQTLEEFAKDKPFVRIVAPEEVRLQAVVGTNRVVMGATIDPVRNVVIALAAVDNLVKGAAGQAVQNANLMFKLNESTGLLGLAGHMP
jgi:N-acetyl-gamma-glutamyl-phosphate reductase